MNRTRLRIVVSLVALSILVAACGDDSGTPFGSSTSAGVTTTIGGGETTTSLAGETTTTTTTGQGTTTTGGEETTTTGPAGEGTDIDQLLEQYRQVPLRTTYLMGEEPDRQEITFSQDPTQDPPASAVLFEDGKMITVGDSYIFCSGEGAGSQCFEMPNTEGLDMASAMLGPFAGLVLSLQGMTDIAGVDVESQQITIAGRSGVCFTYRPEAALGTDLEYARQCVDTELGFSLLFEVKEAGSDQVERVMELVSVGEPQPEDFEPTGPVMTIPEG